MNGDNKVSGRKRLGLLHGAIQSSVSIIYRHKTGNWT